MKYHSFWLGIITKTPYHFMKTVKNIKVMNLLPAFLFTKKKLIETSYENITFKKEEDKLDNPYCKKVLNNELPFTIGGGIGQSRLCMYFLKKKHIGEVQATYWPKEMKEKLETMLKRKFCTYWCHIISGI